jgi:hypothetical protein
VVEIYDKFCVFDLTFTSARMRKLKLINRACPSLTQSLHEVENLDASVGRRGEERHTRSRLIGGN